jgi:AraC-like DNA-binding protein
LQTIVVTTACVAMAAFCASALLLRRAQFPAGIPLAVILAALCFACGGPLVGMLWPDALIAFYEYTLPAYLSIPTALWFFVRCSAQPEESGFDVKEQVWIGSLILMVGLVTLDVLVPDMSGRAPIARAAYVAVVAGLWILALGAWSWSTIRFASSARELLVRYTKRLHMQFSDTQGRDLGGARGLFLPIALVWAFLFVVAVVRNVGGYGPIPEIAIALVFLVLIWSMALWSLTLRQGPARLKDEGGKYARSALDHDRAGRIAAKLDMAMRNGGLFRDANLSLDQLARHLGTSPNHVSQTLNSVIGCSFFEYVNRFRIEASFDQLRSGERSVLEIAFATGFNAKSSFYRAFSRETGMTPTAWVTQANSGAGTP